MCRAFDPPPAAKDLLSRQEGIARGFHCGVAFLQSIDLPDACAGLESAIRIKDQSKSYCAVTVRLVGGAGGFCPLPDADLSAKASPETVLLDPAPILKLKLTALGDGA